VSVMRAVCKHLQRLFHLTEYINYSWDYSILVFYLMFQSRVGSNLEDKYRGFIRSYLDDCDSKGIQLGALLMEPLMLGAGGLKFIDPLFQKVLVQESRSRGMPIVFDEVNYHVRCFCPPPDLSCMMRMNGLLSLT
jgi:4-aminobutyrate aminotransferase-like enzyme